MIIVKVLSGLTTYEMRRSWAAEAEGLEILRWGSSGKRVVRPMVVESVREGVDEGL